MQLKREVGAKGQVVIPKDIREYMGIMPGSKVVFDVSINGVVIRKEPPPEDFVEKFCRTTAPKKHVTIKEIKKTLEEQYDLP